MAKITATDGFDELQLEPEVVEAMGPFLEWINTNTQNIVSALNGNLTTENFAATFVEIKAVTGILKSVKTDRFVKHVSFSRVVCQASTGVIITGFNWWPSEEGFEFIIEYSGEKTDRNVILRVEYDR